jgi:hypothetical protein
MLKTFTTNIAITSSERKLDALRSGGVMKLPRSDLDKKGPLCKLIHSSRERVRVREREHLSGVIDGRSWRRSVVFRCGAGIARVAGQRRRAEKLVLDIHGDISAGSDEWWRSTWHSMD